MNDKEILLEQYKIFVETTNKVSSQRSISNNFFIATNTTLIAILPVIVTKIINISEQSFFINAICIAGLLMNIVWFLSIKSYKSLNKAKFEVINNIEKEKLPIQPFYDEWEKLESGKWYEKYLTLTKIESFLPLIIGLFFILIIIFNPLPNTKQKDILNTNVIEIESLDKNI